jgi:hypothetical protein
MRPGISDPAVSGFDEANEDDAARPTASNFEIDWDLVARLQRMFRSQPPTVLHSLYRRLYPQIFEHGYHLTLPQSDFERFFPSRGSQASAGTEHRSERSLISDAENEDAEADKCYLCGDGENAGSESHELFRMPCGRHHVCIHCTRHAIASMTADEAVYPVACASERCGPVRAQFWIAQFSVEWPPLDDSALLAKFEAKVAEYNIDITRRIYCANPECELRNGTSVLLSKLAVAFSGEPLGLQCTQCLRITCGRCKHMQEMLDSHICANDTAVEAYIHILPSDRQWRLQQCPGCSIWVERTDGCNRMICLCDQQFYLICSSAWGNAPAFSCSRGCPMYEAAVYDNEGYNQRAYHRLTGLDREGREADTTPQRDGDMSESNTEGNDSDISESAWDTVELFFLLDPFTDQG